MEETSGGARALMNTTPNIQQYTDFIKYYKVQYSITHYHVVTFTKYHKLPQSSFTYPTVPYSKNDTIYYNRISNYNIYKLTYSNIQ